MKPSFGEYNEGYGAALLCSICGGNCLHHERVEVFECGEDEQQGIHVSVAEGAAIVNTSMQGNPSKRRHGLSIHLWCENCSAKSVLTIAQHKGLTLIDFNKTSQTTDI